MAANQLVQARINGVVKDEAAAVLGRHGLDRVRCRTVAADTSGAGQGPTVRVADSQCRHHRGDEGSQTGRSPAVHQACRPSWPTCVRTSARTGQVKREYTREARGQHRASLDASLVPILVALADDQPREPRHRDHPLSGEWADHRDGHVKPDLVLIDQKPDGDTLRLVRLGSPAELGAVTSCSAGRLRRAIRLTNKPGFIDNPVHKTIRLLS